MRKALLILGGALVLLIAAVLIVPSFWDWNRYRPIIAEKVEAATGRRLAIDGDVRLVMLPAPSLSATRVRLANVAGFTDPELATLEELRIRLAFLPLLRGMVLSESVELVRPAIHLER